MKAKDVCGRITFYGDFIMPLEEAHKIQMILAKYAKGIETVYRSGGEEAIQYVKDISIPNVVALSEMPKHSAEGLHYRVISEWCDAVRGSEGEDFLSPQDFANLTKEEE